MAHVSNGIDDIPRLKGSGLVKMDGMSTDGFHLMIQA